MKAISIKQPWAWLIVNRYKPVENRRWKTSYRGPILIHAGKSFDFEGLRGLCRFAHSDYLEVVDYFNINTARRSLMKCRGEFGGIVGEAVLANCVTEFDSPYFFGPYGFVLEERKPLPFVAMPGKLGIFEVDFSQEVAGAPA